MPKKPKKPCAYPGCSRLTDGTYCEEHVKVLSRQYKQYSREPEHSRRYGRSWQRIRNACLAAHPLCERCDKSGRYVSAEEVHHNVPLRDGGHQRLGQPDEVSATNATPRYTPRWARGHTAPCDTSWMADIM